MHPIHIAIVVLATTRIVRAITTEDVGAPIRRHIVSTFVSIGYRIADRKHPRMKDGEYPPNWSTARIEHYSRSHHYTVERWTDHGNTLATCPWCLGFWISVAAVIWIAVIPHTITVWLAAPWALSYVVALLDGLADRA